MDRYEHIGRRLLAVGGVFADEREVMGLLGEVGRRVWRPDNVAFTVYSAVFNLTERTMTWVSNENFDDPAAWFTFRL